MRRALLPFSAVVAFAIAPANVQAQDFIVVVNSVSPITTLSKAQLSNIFLKRTTKWTGGKTIVPVDRDKSSKVRDAFSGAVHGRSSSAINTYWQTQIFSGQAIPPIVKTSDEDVLAFVRSNVNAISYVPAGTPLGQNVKAVTISGL
jgi:ABC-type phosphate transport system substrate-binding protein